MAARSGRPLAIKFPPKSPLQGPIYDIIGGLYDIDVMFDYYYGIAAVRNLCNTIIGFSTSAACNPVVGSSIYIPSCLWPFAQFGGKLDALSLPPEKVVAGCPNLYTPVHILYSFKFIEYPRYFGKEFARFVNGHFKMS